MTGSEFRRGTPGNPVPTNLITGFLGVGKTTVIRHLLSAKPSDEVWAVLVNEFGPIGLDDAFLTAATDPKAADKARDTGIAVRMIPGGCICCDANVTLTVAIKEMIARIRPDRLLIEPTGLGHPSGILDCMAAFERAGAIERRAVVCLVDPGRLSEPRIRESAVFVDQINLADILVATKTDLRTDEDLAAFDTLAAACFPPRAGVLRIAQGRLPLSVLDEKTTGQRLALFPDAHKSARHDHGPDTGPGPDSDHDHDHDRNHRDGDHALGGMDEPMPGRPQRLTAANDDAIVCGWLFHADDRFDAGALSDRVADSTGSLCPGLQHADRVKAVIRTEAGAQRVERAGGEASAEPIAYRGASRIEAIFPADAFPVAKPGADEGGQDAAFDRIERCLIDCLKRPNLD